MEIISREEAGTAPFKSGQVAVTLDIKTIIDYKILFSLEELITVLEVGGISGYNRINQNIRGADYQLYPE
ncbi:MAG: hypothetical protein JXB45_04815 [Candidatus Krumholzibacteriota bacterium]|nr:hypothetical protein [Candidatus Krumholzibacteriota bacterium]